MPTLKRVTMTVLLLATTALSNSIPIIPYAYRYRADVYQQLSDYTRAAADRDLATVNFTSIITGYTRAIELNPQNAAPTSTAKPIADMYKYDEAIADYTALLDSFLHPCLPQPRVYSQHY